jgi:hypothetical protein
MQTSRPFWCIAFIVGYMGASYPDLFLTCDSCQSILHGVGSPDDEQHGLVRIISDDHESWLQELRRKRMIGEDTPAVNDMENEKH